MNASGGLAGLTVRPAALTDAGRAACALVGELDAIRRHWRRGVAGCAGAAGLREAEHAIAEVVERWDAELGVYLDALRALCVGLPAAAAGYDDADAATAAELPTETGPQAEAALRAETGPRAAAGLPAAAGLRAEAGLRAAAELAAGG